MMMKNIFHFLNKLKNMIMRKFIGYKLIGLALIVAGLAACDTASQDVEPIVSPESYPVATITPATSSTTIKEGDTLTYIITTNKMIDRAVTFSAIVTGGTADSDDFTTEPAVLQPYSKETKLHIIANEDNMPEVSETLNIEVSIESIAERYLVNPNTVLPTASLTIENHNDPSVLTITFGWPNHDDDIDIFAYYGEEDWGSAATSANPEVLTTIWPADPNGMYYFGIDPYYVTTPTFDYIISIGHPDGRVEFFEGTFDTENLESYTVDTYDSWDEYPTYRLLEIVNTDGVFTITHLN